MNGKDNIHAEAEAGKDYDSPPSQDGNAETSQNLAYMDNTNKTLLTVCGVLLATIIAISLLCGSFLKAIPLAVSDNHDDIIELRVTQDSHSAGIDKNTATQQAASIERKAMERAILMLSGDVKHLTSSVERQNEATNDKLDTLGRYWMEFNTNSSR